MSQKAEKRMRRAWRNRMKAVAGGDWKQSVKMIEKLALKVHRQKIVIVILSVISVTSITVLIWMGL